MRALLYPEFNALSVADQPMPEISQDEVLIRVAACGICGSELESFKTQSPRRTPPLIMGHEFCGTIEQVGSDVNGFKVGQKVVSNALVSCNKCIRCERDDTHLCADRQIFGMHRAGAFAEFVNVPEVCLTEWPENLPGKAACLAEPLANGLHIVNLTEHLNPEHILIIGAGPIGLMTLQAFKAKRSANITVSEISEARLDAASKLGADKTINSVEADVLTAILEVTNGEGADLVVDAAGNAITNKLAIEALRPGGTAVFIGLLEDNNAVQSYDLILAEKKIIGTYAAKMEELKEALELMSTAKVDVGSWIHTFPLDQGFEGFELMLEGKDAHIKGVLCP